MNQWLDISWFAVQARTFRESLAAASVSALDVEVFLPKIKAPQPVGGVTREVEKPLFNGYLFARFCPLVLLDAVRFSPGVLRVLSCGTAPIPVENEIIESIKCRIQPDGFIRLERAALRPGDRIEIGSGPFSGWIGRVEHEWDDGRRVSILLETIQQARVVVERKAIEAAFDCA